MKKTILLTGATGFIGRHCLPLLRASGYEIHAVSSQARQRDPLGTHWHVADLLDPEQVSALIATVKPTHLLHLAWYAEHGKYWTSAQNLHWVRASLALLHAFALNGGRRVVITGTCAEYDWRYGYCSEDITPLSPSTLYGACKHSLQLMTAAFAREVGLSTAWARIFLTYGPHEHPERLVPSVIRSALRGRHARCRHAGLVRDFLYVEDVASALLAVLQSPLEGAVNIGSGQPISVGEVVRKIREQCGNMESPSFEPRDQHSGEPPLLVADTSKLHRAAAWTARYKLDEGLARTIRWWKSEPAAQRSGTNGDRRAWEAPRSAYHAAPLPTSASTAHRRHVTVHSRVGAKQRT